MYTWLLEIRSLFQIWIKWVYVLGAQGVFCGRKWSVTSIQDMKNVKVSHQLINDKLTAFNHLFQPYLVYDKKSTFLLYFFKNYKLRCKNKIHIFQLKWIHNITGSNGVIEMVLIYHWDSNFWHWRQIYLRNIGKLY